MRCASASGRRRRWVCRISVGSEDCKGRMKDEAMQPRESQDEWKRIAEAIRAACVRAAQQGYERAAADGLCDEGALEVALEAIRSLDIDQLVHELKSSSSSRD